MLKKSLIDNQEIASQVQWDKWEVYFSDERLVPLNHPDSNFGLFNELVLAELPAGTPKPKVYTIDESLLTGSDGQVAGADLEKGSCHRQGLSRKVAKGWQARLNSFGLRSRRSYLFSFPLAISC